MRSRDACTGPRLQGRLDFHGHFLKVSYKSLYVVWLSARPKGSAVQAGTPSTIDVYLRQVIYCCLGCLLSFASALKIPVTMDNIILKKSAQPKLST